MLRRRHKRLAREIARESFIACQGDIEAALEYFKNSPRLLAVDVTTLILMIKLAVELWQWWKSRNIDEPSTVASLDEAFALGDDFFSEDDDE
jgi:predicted signal transduction protein with EAL and GGDEF domain